VENTMPWFVGGIFQQLESWEWEHDLCSDRGEGSYCG
jgi:hypothetical protein